jgi:site-specific recombinase XerD
MKMERYINEFLGNLDAPFAENTRLTYGMTLHQYFNWVHMNDYDCLSPDTIYKWFDYLRAQGVKPSSLHLKRSALRSFFAYCIEENYVSINPALKVKLEKLKPVKRSIMSDQEAFKLCEASQYNLRDRTIIQLMIDAGLRVSEVCRLDIRDADLDLTLPSLHVDPGKNRTDRIIPLTHLAAAFLKNYLDSRTDHYPALFITRLGNRFTRQGMDKLFNYYKNKAKIKSIYTTHSYRRKFATKLANSGFEVYEIAKFMGHLNVDSSVPYINRSRKDRSNSHRNYNQD